MFDINEFIKNNRRIVIIFSIFFVAFFTYNYKTEIICDKNSNTCSLYKSSVILPKQEKVKLSIDDAKKMNCSRYYDYLGSKHNKSKYALKFNNYDEIIYSHRYSNVCYSTRLEILRNIQKMSNTSETTVYSKIL